MAKINLLPWREAYRKEKKQEFLTILGGCFIIFAAAAYIWVSSVEGDIENQEGRNRTLETEIAALDKQVKEIADLKKVRDALLARIKIIQDLQGTRPLIVRYFDDLVRDIPDGVFIRNLSRQGDSISMDGVAESYSRIAALMRNFEESPWFADAQLPYVAAAPAEGDQANTFRLIVKLTVPPDVDSGAVKKPDAKASRGNNK